LKHSLAVTLGVEMSNKALITTIIFLLGYVFVYSQGSYDWNEHNDAWKILAGKVSVLAY